MYYFHEHLCCHFSARDIDTPTDCDSLANCVYSFNFCTAVSQPAMYDCCREQQCCIGPSEMRSADVGGMSIASLDCMQQFFILTTCISQQR